MIPAQVSQGFRIHPQRFERGALTDTRMRRSHSRPFDPKERWVSRALELQVLSSSELTSSTILPLPFLLVDIVSSSCSLDSGTNSLSVQCRSLKNRDPEFCRKRVIRANDERHRSKTDLLCRKCPNSLLHLSCVSPVGTLVRLCGSGSESHVGHLS